MGVFNEAALQRFDLVLSEAAKNGIKVIFPLVNGNNFLGGPQWYFDQARTPCSQAGRLAAYENIREPLLLMHPYVLELCSFVRSCTKVGASVFALLLKY